MINNKIGKPGRQGTLVYVLKHGYRIACLNSNLSFFIFLRNICFSNGFDATVTMNQLQRSSIKIFNIPHLRLLSLNAFQCSWRRWASTQIGQAQPGVENSLKNPSSPQKHIKFTSESLVFFSRMMPYSSETPTDIPRSSVMLDITR